jgi:hypothetical protein
MKLLLMFIRRRMREGCALRYKPLLKSAWEGLCLHTGSGRETAIEKFGELGKNREEAVTLTG